MFPLMRIAERNLRRYTRRTLLTSILISIGIVTVLLFVSFSGSFKNVMIGTITDSMLAHVQIHKLGFVSAIENAPLNLNMTSAEIDKAEVALKSSPLVESYSKRLRFSAMISNYSESTNGRFFGIDSTDEIESLPLLSSRLMDDDGKELEVSALERGQIWIPQLIAGAMNIKIGSPVVLIASNKDGSVNGISLTVSAIVSSATGPGGRDGYVNIADTQDLFRTPSTEYNEIAVRLKDIGTLPKANAFITKSLETGEQLEVHSWKELSPFANVVKIIDLLTLFVKVILTGIVLVAIMNVMIMAVYERVREIGTIAAIGTSPAKIRMLFVYEGMFLGIFGGICGSVISGILIAFFRYFPLSMSFGRNESITLIPTISFQEFILANILVIIMATMASLYPAYKASTLEPVDALRSY